MTTIEKILAEFDALLSHFKNSKELPNTAVNEIRRKTNTQLEAEIKSFLSESIKQNEQDVRMEYLLEFGNYVPLGEGDISPQVMAKTVVNILEEKNREEMMKSIYDYLYTHRTADNDEIVFVKFNKKDFLSLSSLQDTNPK